MLKKVVFSLFCAFFLIGTVFCIDNDDEITVAVFSTTDLHGVCGEINPINQKPYEYTIDKISTIIKEQRSQFENTIVIDNGDLFQGTLTMNYATTVQKEKINPMIQGITQIGYDVFEMGNHEFNYFAEYRDLQMRYLHKNGIAVLGGANIVLKEDGVDYLGKKAKKGAPYYEPYFIKTFKKGNKKVKVAVIGFGNNHNASWDAQSHYPNVQFGNPGNKNEELSYDMEKWISYVKKNEKPDIIIITAHNGKYTDDSHDVEANKPEAQISTAVRNTSGFDLMIYGHDHYKNIYYVTNKQGKEVPLVNGGQNSVTKSVFTIKFNKNKISDVKVANELISIKDYKADDEMLKITQKWNDEAYEWATKTVAKFGKGWTSANKKLANKTNEYCLIYQTELMNLIHKGFIWATWQKEINPDMDGATVSILSPTFEESKTNEKSLTYLPEDGDPVSLINLARLYRYSTNNICMIDMTADQIYRWMNACADRLDCAGGGKIAAGESLYNIDNFYGIDYTFDLTKPKGQRVVSAVYQGKPLLEYDKKIRVTLTNYRLNGTGNFLEITGLNRDNELLNLEIKFGPEAASGQINIGNYLKTMESFSPDCKTTNGISSEWKIIAN